MNDFPFKTCEFNETVEGIVDESLFRFFLHDFKKMKDPTMGPSKISY